MSTATDNPALSQIGKEIAENDVVLFMKARPCFRNAASRPPWSRC
jgi:hypothetical protein